MSIYRPQVGFMQINNRKKNQEQDSEAYPGMSLTSPTDRPTDRPTVESQRIQKTLHLVNNSIIMICIKIAVTVFQPCQKYCDIKLDEAMAN